MKVNKQKIVNKSASCAMYKFLSILGYIELISIPAFLIYIYSMENSSFRPRGTLLIAFGVSFVVFIVNLLLLIPFFIEYKFRKNEKFINRVKFTHVGSIIYVVILLFSLFWFLINLI